MITKIYFETFASGMKARLDPAYRRVYEMPGRRESVEIPRKEIKSAQSAFIPFANIRKTI